MADLIAVQSSLLAPDAAGDGSRLVASAAQQ
jgi:hypothetical protein